jgi:hypothetical protein
MILGKEVEYLLDLKFRVCVCREWYIYACDVLSMVEFKKNKIKVFPY